MTRRTRRALGIALVTPGPLAFVALILWLAWLGGWQSWAFLGCGAAFVVGMNLLDGETLWQALEPPESAQDETKAKHAR